MAAARVALLAFLALTSAAALRTVHKADPDHLVHETVDNADGKKMTTPAEKDFAALDTDRDGKLTTGELMFRQYSTGCEASEAQIRAIDYFICGDANKDNAIDGKEFEASSKAAWTECVKDRSDRRAHGFMRFFEADDDFDGKVTKVELLTAMKELWGDSADILAAPYMKCSDANKDGVIDQDEFHDTISFYNPQSRKFVGDNSKVLSCLDAAMVDFDTNLAFQATDRNKDKKISKSEAYTVASTMAPTISQAKVDAMFTAADVDKSGYLSFDEFKKAGESYKGENEGTSFVIGGAGMPSSSLAAAGSAKGMSVACNAPESKWSFFAAGGKNTTAAHGLNTTVTK